MTALMKKRILWIVYGAIALVCVIAFSVAAVWASQGALSTEITEILSAEVTIDTETQETPETTRTEYIVGEPLDTTGAAIRVTTKEGDVVTPSLEECTIEADMDTAGVKPVVIAWQQGTILYRGSYEIEVFAVRHLDVQPNDGDETLVYEQSATELDKTGIEVWADLSGSPDTMEKPNSEWSNVVRLTPEQFTLTSSEMGTPGIHNATIAAGRATASFTFSSAASSGTNLGSVVMTVRPLADCGSSSVYRFFFAPVTCGSTSSCMNFLIKVDFPVRTGPTTPM